MGIEGEHVAWGRLYMEVIEQDGADIDQMVRDAYRPQGPSDDGSRAPSGRRDPMAPTRAAPHRRHI